MKNICQELFGKSHSQLTSDELKAFRRLAKSVSHYRHHKSTTRSMRDRHADKKRKVLDALGIPAACQACGYAKYIGALDFHHTDPNVKENKVLKGSLESSITEARKCQLICANCHRERHALEPVKTSGRPRENNTLLDKYLAIVGVSR